MPTAPVPAYPSITRAPSTRGATMLNSVSRSLSDVGLSPSHVGASSRRPLYEPAITRMSGRAALPYFNQFELRLPAVEQAGDCARARHGRGEPGRRFVLRDLQHLAIAREIHDAER